MSHYTPLSEGFLREKRGVKTEENMKKTISALNLSFSVLAFNLLLKSALSCSFFELFFKSFFYFIQFFMTIILLSDFL